MRWAVLVVLAGCDLAFSLDRPGAAPDGATGDGPYDRCGPFLYDEPLRYATVNSPNIDETGAHPWSWSEARTVCRILGMDLAVLNDPHELRVAGEVPAVPVWIGASRSGGAWSSVDGCPAMMPAGGGGDECAVVTPGAKVDGTRCDGMLAPSELYPEAVIAALCETPRPETDGCLGNEPARTTYELSPGVMSYAAARDYCSARDAKPVVLETHAEWLHVAALVSAELRAPFWIGATFDGTRWGSDNACPASYSWAAGRPSRLPVSGDCTHAVVITREDAENAGTFLTGQDVAACNASEIHALCER